MKYSNFRSDPCFKPTVFTTFLSECDLMVVSFICMSYSNSSSYDLKYIIINTITFQLIDQNDESWWGGGEGVAGARLNCLSGKVWVPNITECTIYDFIQEQVLLAKLSFFSNGRTENIDTDKALSHSRYVCAGGFFNEVKSIFVDSPKQDTTLLRIFNRTAYFVT